MNFCMKKGFNTGFKDNNGKEIHVGDQVVETCNLLVSTVYFDEKEGTYKLKGLGDYYIKEASTEWIILESFDKIQEKELNNFPKFLSLDEFNKLNTKKEA